VRKSAAVISLSILVAFLIASALLIHPFGYPPSQMDDYIIQNAQGESGANSVVDTIVFDYRGFDTLGEATILFAAVTGVVMLFRRRKKETTN